MSTCLGFHGVPPVGKLPLQTLYDSCSLAAVTFCGVGPSALDLGLDVIRFCKVTDKSQTKLTMASSNAEFFIPE